MSASYFFWPTIRKDIGQFVEHYRTCQLAKCVATNVGLYMLPLIPSQLRSDISMDFVLGLPCIERGSDSIIFVVVDHFSKMAHFILRKRSADAVHVAKVVLPRSISPTWTSFLLFLDRDT